MKLMVEVLLVFSAALLQAAEGQVYPLDMAVNSVDDRYKGCGREMKRLVKEVYLPRELSNYSDFRAAWKDAESKHHPESSGLLKRRHYLTAIFVYTNSDLDVFRHFNADVRSGRRRYGHDGFRWNSLHFWLTKAIQALKQTQNQCRSTYRGVNVGFKKNVLNKKIRFGSFTSSSLSRSVAQAFGNVSCFEIRTCEGAELTEYSKFPHEKEVLIPPYEMFKVTRVQTRRKQKDLWCNTVFTVEHSGTTSNTNCAVTSAKQFLTKLQHLRS